MYVKEESIKPLLLTTNTQLQNVYAPNLLQLPSTEKMIKFVNKCKTWMFATYIDVNFNETDKIDIDFSKYPNLMNGICITNFKCNNIYVIYLHIILLNMLEQLVMNFCDGVNVIKIDLSSLSHITSIGYHFLSGCKNLTEIDLSPLSHVTSIGN